DLVGFGSGHAQAHRGVGGADFGREDRVAVLGFAVEDRGDAGAAHALGAGPGDGDVVFGEHVEDLAAGGHVEGDVAAGEHDVEGSAKSDVGYQSGQGLAVERGGGPD